MRQQYLIPKEEQLRDICSVSKWSEVIGIPIHTLRRHVKVRYHMTPIELLTSIRLKKVIVLLKTDHFSLKEIAHCIGIKNAKLLSEFIRYHTGKSPSHYK